MPAGPPLRAPSPLEICLPGDASTTADLHSQRGDAGDCGPRHCCTTHLPAKLEVTLEYSPAKVGVGGPAVHPFLLDHTAEFAFTKRRRPRRREGIIPRCVTVRPVLSWRKTTHRLRISRMGVRRLPAPEEPPDFCL